MRFLKVISAMFTAVLSRYIAAFSFAIFLAQALSSPTTTVFAQEFCPTRKSFDCSSNCKCPPGYQRGLQVFGGGTCGESCEKWGNDATQVELSCTHDREVAQNFRWFTADAAKSALSASVQGRILRAISVSALGDIEEIRSAYKDGQRHNTQVASLIDDCDDSTISRIAYEFSESVRLKRCTDPQPAASANCIDLIENVRWSLLDNHNCSVYSRQLISNAFDSGVEKKIRAERVRRAVQTSEGHRPDLARSVDFISDGLLLQMAEKVYREYNISSLDRRPPDRSNPFIIQACPGVTLYNKYH